MTQHSWPELRLDDPKSFTKEYAEALDAQDPLRKLREEFVIPTRAGLKRKRLGTDAGAVEVSETINALLPENELTYPCTYLCGNSLGLQPRCTQEYIRKYLDTWANKGVYGHFQPLEDAVSKPWVDIDEDAKVETAKIVGAQPEEVAVMQTLTANLHLLMASFYRPTKERYKIIIEGKAFPSDHYAVQSQLHHHNLHPSTALVELNPPDPGTSYLPTSYILSVIDAHASSTALLLLPGIQYYSGQFLDIPTITAYAQARGIIVGWDLAHAVGNVPLKLHDWNADFAAWCNYKYMNGGPGVIGGLFVHSKHTSVNHSPSPPPSDDQPGTTAITADTLGYRPRLSGWWGHDKSTRFQMRSTFVPIPGAAGFQLSNPSALDTTALLASLSVFAKTSVADLRAKSLRLTAYLEHLLFTPTGDADARPYSLITPRNPDERGAQLSLLLRPGLLERVMEELEHKGVVVDERRPDVVRVAPAPLYNGFADVWRFVDVFREACRKAVLEAGVAVEK
ncbi:putative kynureninase protein [Lasiodiplodia theobromae]|uniref:Kynureninase protein n=1 Tax=Lasiodiplodia theobromae TaxID=45133 RepID=UPI0015C40D9B|nr:Kynureninase protein [Lasiodiplodia theobromae]KAF4545028.1 Kynureninase protein [Lasiodiplodia theobromae]KAF9631685.1 putative kynureninase protein [Lasiodiplodia theobromae]